MRTNNVLKLLPAFLLTACSGTTVVLVPDATGKVGEVAVKTKAGEQVLSKAGQFTNAKDMEKLPDTVTVMNEEKIKDKFGSALANEPAPPLHYVIQFGSGSAALALEVKSQLVSVFRDIQARKSCDVSVIGHCDRTGDDKSNKELSLQRAEAVANELKAAGFDGQCMDIRYYGENDPVVHTADNVSEPRNRRVEIEVR